MSRPSIYSDEIAAAVRDALVEDMSLRRLCRRADMPSRPTIFRWLATRPEFARQYAIAKEMEADAIGDLLIDIADDGSGDWKRKWIRGEWRWVVDLENIERARLRCHTLQWLMARLAPKKYGSRVAIAAQVAHSPANAPNSAAVLLEGVTPHSLRHTFASVAAELGFSELTIAGLLGCGF